MPSENDVIVATAKITIQFETDGYVTVAVDLLLYSVTNRSMVINNRSTTTRVRLCIYSAPIFGEAVLRPLPCCARGQLAPSVTPKGDFSACSVCSLPSRNWRTACGEMRNRCSHVMWLHGQSPSCCTFHSAFYVPHSERRSSAFYP